MRAPEYYEREALAALGDEKGGRGKQLLATSYRALARALVYATLAQAAAARAWTPLPPEYEVVTR
jgi:hypothetical protein